MSKVIDKLQKLIAMERGAREIGNQHEAEAFAAKVASMLTEHKLTMSEVEYQAQAIANPFGSERVQQKGGGSCPAWRMRLANALAKSMYCKMFYVKGKNAVSFVGRDSDRNTVISMYNHLGTVAKKLAQKELRARKSQGSMTLTDNHWIKSFLIGFADGIANRLSEQDRLMFEATQTHGLILRDAAALDQYIQGALVLGRPTQRKSTPMSSDAYVKGLRHGTSTSMTAAKHSLGSGN